jgi:hypothetical protein
MLAGLLIAQGLALPDLSWPPLWGILIAATSLLVSQPDRAQPAFGAIVATSPTGDLPTKPALA